MKARDVMTAAATVGVDETVTAAIAALIRAGASLLTVVDSSGRAVGVLFEGDLLALQGATAASGGDRIRRVGDVMRRSFVAVHPSDDLELCRRVLQADAASVPVAERGRVMGQIGRRDLLRAMTRDDRTLHREVVQLLEEIGCHDAIDSIGVADGVIRIALDVDTSSGRRAARAVRDLPGARGVVLESSAESPRDELEARSRS